MGVKKKINPFLVSGYLGPQYFCDREKETETLINAFRNKRNTVLFSPRRLGKTGLIKHVLYKLNKEDVITIYLDIYASLSIEDFVRELANAIAAILAEQKKTFMENIQKIFSSIRPRISFDDLSGNPVLELGLTSSEHTYTTLEELLQYLDRLEKPVVIAIDEFQQIANYEQKQGEALMRSKIQHLKNVNFIFSGSQQHMLITMFGNRSRPFYQSAQFLKMGKIPEKKYADFIRKKMKTSNKEINKNEILFILNWTNRHTYYTQHVCNRLFALKDDKITEKGIKYVFNEILHENAPIYFSYRSLLTRQQWKVLSAISKAGNVLEPYSKDFIYQYKLGAVSSTRRAIQSLLKSEMIFEVFDEKEKKTAISVYDVFLGHWMKYNS